MIQRKPEGNRPITLHGFLVGVEIEEGETTPDKVVARIQDALTWVNGIANTDCEYLGQIEQVGEEAPQ